MGLYNVYFKNIICPSPIFTNPLNCFDDVQLAELTKIKYFCDKFLIFWNGYGMSSNSLLIHFFGVREKKKLKFQQKKAYDQTSLRKKKN